MHDGKGPPSAAANLLFRSHFTGRDESHCWFEYFTRCRGQCSVKNKAFRPIVCLLIASLGVGCTTAYDYDGRPRQVVEPGAAILGAAAVGLLAYGLASSHHDRDHGHYSRQPSYSHGSYGHGYYGSRGYYPRGYDCRY